MAHSPHANIPEQARLSLAPGHVARRANAYLIALVSRSAAMMTWENHASAIPPTPLSGTVACLGSACLLICRGILPRYYNHTHLVSAMMMIFIRSIPLSDRLIAIDEGTTSLDV